MQPSREELAYESTLADTGELAGVVAHEFNDILNTILLHVALVERNVPEDIRRDLGEIRKQGRTIADLVRQFQRYRQNQRPADRPVDLNQTLTDAVHSSAENTGVALALDPSPVPVAANAADIRRVINFLLRNARATTPAAAAITIRTSYSGSHAVLSVEDSGPRLAPEDLSRFFDLHFTGRAGTNSLELAACKRLVRRLRGEIRCENRAEGGLAVIAELPLNAQRE
ncbi:MAG TPA: HAMP domain-containing sensor histidine kinase [Gemmataceae bacterium]|jgi:two-component system sensor histidine kinase FlrB|nr:HAMP domain-containing sensor histidine kinase [Gemmataceae bacterium]